MARKINWKKPLEGDDAQYVRDRPWLIQDATLMGFNVRFADDLDGDFEVEEVEEVEEAEEAEEEAEEIEEEETEDYSSKEWTVKALTTEIDRRNEDREEDDQIIPDTGNKADLIAALIADDEAAAESEDEETE